MQRTLGQHVVQAGRLKIGRQEHSPPAIFNRQHDAVGVGSRWQALWRRMENFKPTPRAAGQPIATGNHAKRRLCPFDGVAQESDRGVGLVEHHRRNVNRSHGKPLQQFRQGVVVIAVGMREHHRIDVRESRNQR